MFGSGLDLLVLDGFNKIDVGIYANIVLVLVVAHGYL